MNSNRFEEVDEYISNLFSCNDKYLADTEKRIIESNMPEISLSPVQGKFLCTLASLCNAQKILEIGTLGGYSTIWLARALPEEGHLITIEVNPQYAKVAEQNISRAGFDSRVTIRTGNALQVLPEIISEELGPFDMIFIDADKTSYTEYFQHVLKLSLPGTLIVADNVIREGNVLDEKSSDEKVKGAQRFNSMLASCPDVTAVILQTVGVKGHDGMALAVVKQ